MAIPERWNRNPRPDPAVLALLATLQKAAERGEIRAVAIVTLNPTLQVEKVSAGEIDETGVRKRLLAAGLIEISSTLLKP